MKNRWIPVSDKMPEERDSMFAKFKGTSKWKEAMFEKISKDVLVTILFKQSLFVQSAHTVDGKWKNDLLKLGRKVVAWMPFPLFTKSWRTVMTRLLKLLFSCLAICSSCSLSCIGNVMLVLVLSDLVVM